jgi:RNA polymerase sporulation-specific sigma factor
VTELGREPSVAEIAATLGLPREEVVYALDAIQEPISLFEPVYHDGGDPIYVMDQVGDEHEHDGAWLESLTLRDAMERLSERERTIIRLRFFAGKTQMEVASEIGISQAQVSRLEKAALGRMRSHV